MSLEVLISLLEVESTLKAFAKDKIPGPDGWTFEFYLHFLPLLSPEIVNAMEDSHISGIDPNALNTTYLTLIPKKEHPDSLNDYRPIYLCNLLYKLISKIIAERLKSFMGKFISVEQFSFLLDRQIIDVMG